MCENVSSPLHCASKICSFVDTAISCFFWILIVTLSRLLLTMSLFCYNTTHLNISCHTFRDLLRLFCSSLQPFFTNIYALSQSTADLTPHIHIALYIFCVHSQPGGTGLSIPNDDINDVITITYLGKCTWFYCFKKLSFSQKHTTHWGWQCAIPFQFHYGELQQEKGTNKNP